MIESRYWRSALRDNLTWLYRHHEYRRWSEKQLVFFERKLMMVAFQIRSLLERSKVNDHASRTCMPVLRYKKIGEIPFTFSGSGWPEDRFDMKHPEPDSLCVFDVCNQLIHYYWMQTFSGGKAFVSMLVFSDYKRHKWAYEFKIQNLLKLFSVFCDDSSSVVSVLKKWDEKKQDFIVVEADGL